MLFANEMRCCLPCTHIPTPLSLGCQVYDDVPQEAAYLESDLGQPEIPKGSFERWLGLQSTMKWRISVLFVVVTRYHRKITRT